MYMYNVMYLQTWQQVVGLLTYSLYLILLDQDLMCVCVCVCVCVDDHWVAKTMKESHGQTDQLSSCKCFHSPNPSMHVHVHCNSPSSD